MALKVAIVGLAADSRTGIPWGTDWEVWGLPWDAEYALQFHRTFEPHEMRDLKARPQKWLSEHLERLGECSNLYMQEAYPEVPNAIRYPREEVAKTVQDEAWASSIAYAMALAIHEGAQEISLYGVHMEAHSEYACQRPNLMYLIGFARGRGIEVSVHPASPLMQYVSDPDAHYVGRYGWLG